MEKTLQTKIFPFPMHKNQNVQYIIKRVSISILSCCHHDIPSQTGTVWYNFQK